MVATPDLHIALLANTDEIVQPVGVLGASQYKPRVHIT
jgi:hypothetical protein